MVSSGDSLFSRTQFFDRGSAQELAKCGPILLRDARNALDELAGQAHCFSDLLTFTAGLSVGRSIHVRRFYNNVAHCVNTYLQNTMVLDAIRSSKEMSDIV